MSHMKKSLDSGIQMMIDRDLYKFSYVTVVNVLNVTVVGENAQD